MKITKKILSILLSLMLVLGAVYVPANVGGFLTGGAAIVANADAQIVNTSHILETITGVETDITIDYYDDGSVYISGYGVLPTNAFNSDESITKIVFAEDCAISKIQNYAFECLYSQSPLTDVEINTTVPLSMAYNAFFYEGGTVNFKIKAPEIESISNFICSYGAKVNVVFEEPVMLEPNSFSNMFIGDDSTFTVPYGSAVVRKLKYKFNDRYLNDDYATCSQEGREEQFWQEHESLVEGQDYVTFYGVEFTEPQLQEEYDIESQYGEEFMFWEQHSELVEGTDYVFITEEPEPVLLTQENKSLIFGEYRDWELIIDGEPAEEVISDVTLNTGDGVINSGDITTYTEGIETALPTDITLEGYTFGGWYDNSDCEGTPVTSISADATGPQEFWAKWTANTYTVTWVDENGNELEVDEEVPYGTVPTYDSDEPVKDATAEFTYTFIGWDKDISEVTEDVTYTAVFDGIVNEYTVTWEDDEGNYLYSDDVEYGVSPVFEGEEPTKDATDEFTYTFAGWTDGEYTYAADEELPEVTGEVTYTALFDSEVNEYTVTWEDDQGNVLSTDVVPYGNMPVYDGYDPTKDATAQYTYFFAGWDKEISEVTGDVTYTAVFDHIVNEYTVTWIGADGEELEVDENVPYGTVPTYDSDEPVKDATAEFTYTFIGWDKDISEVTGDVTYTAVFDGIVNEYPVTWVDEDGGILYSNDVDYGESPVFEGEEPTKEATAQYTYVFAGWTDGEMLYGPGCIFPEVTGEVTYTATYSKTAIEYTAKFVDENGETVDEVKFTVETESIEAPAVPAKEGYDGKWSEYTLAAADITIQAEYTAIEYTATFVDENGAVVAEVPYTVETQSIDEPAVPEKDGYTVVWEDYTLATGGVTVKAVYTANDYTATFVDENGETVDKVKFTVEDESITEPAVPEKTNYTGKWEEYTLGTADITIKPIYTLGGETVVNIDSESEITLGYKESKRFAFEPEFIPDGATAHVFYNGEDRGEGTSIEVKEPTDDYTVECKVLDKDGNEIATSGEIKVKVKNSFFDRLKWFFNNFWANILKTFIDALIAAC